MHMHHEPHPDQPAPHASGAPESGEGPGLDVRRLELAVGLGGLVMVAAGMVLLVIADTLAHAEPVRAVLIAAALG